MLRKLKWLLLKGLSNRKVLQGFITQIWVVEISIKAPSAARFATTFTAWIRTSASSASSNDKILCNPTVGISDFISKREHRKTKRWIYIIESA